MLGKTYYPSDDRDYDEKGYASWYGPGFHGGTTANGEPYDMDGLTAAHKTLPLPSFVEVTNLDNDRKVTVRVNDRGPFVEGRIIDLSRRAAQLLGTDRKGVAKVRVKRVYPSDREIAELRLGRVRSTPAQAAYLNPAPAAPPPAPPVVIADAPGAVVATVAVPPSQVAAADSAGTLFVQVAAVSDIGRAEWLVGFLKPYGSAAIERSPGGLYRVRLGPFQTRDAAASALAQVQAAGYQDARIVAPAPVG